MADALGSLRFIGERFESEEGLPLAAGAELAAFQKLIDAVAKHLFMQDNPDRERVARGFSETTRLFLKGVSEGSKVAEVSEAPPNEQTLFPPDEDRSYSLQAFELIVQAYGSPDDLSPKFPPKAVGPLLSFGSSLSGDESVDLKCRTRKDPVSYNSEKRSVLTESLRRFRDERELLIGEVKGVTTDTPTFKLIQAHGSLNGTYDPDEWFETLHEHLTQTTHRVLLDATVRYKGALDRKITQVHEITVVEKQMQGYDEAEQRMEALKQQEFAPTEIALYNGRRMVEALRQTSLRSPTVSEYDGGVHFEWQVGTDPTYIDCNDDGTVDVTSDPSVIPEICREFDDIDKAVHFVQHELDDLLDTELPPAVTI